MILEAETLIKYGYLSMDLKPDSNEPIQAACDECGKMRKTSKNSYRALCKSCAAKGKFPSEKSKALMSTKKKGKYGKDASAYKGGGRISWAKSRSKRKRDLGYTLLLPLEPGEVGHHVTNEYVMGIPEEVHQHIGGSRRKHRTKVLQWLKTHDTKKYKLVLCILAKEPLHF